MWNVKFIEKNSKKTKTINKNFGSEEEANNYIDIYMKNSEDIWVEEKIEVESIDLVSKIGSWLWFYSDKKKEFFPYGILKGITSQFVKIQTKAEMTSEDEYVDMRISRIKDLFEAKQMQISNDGSFVNLKEYI